MVDMNSPYPWQRKTFQRLTEAASRTRLGHALLFCGPPGIGKTTLAETFCAWLLCEQSGRGDTACSECRGCILYAAGNHPDHLRIQASTPGAAILVDQVREITAFFTLKAHYGGYKTVIIDRAEAMNHASANALLKILEEPPPYAIIILITTRIDLLPPTIRSRGQTVNITNEDPDASVAWLAARWPQRDTGDLAAILQRSAWAPVTASARIEDDFVAQEATIFAAMKAVLRSEMQCFAAADSTTEFALSPLIEAMMWQTYRYLWQVLGYEKHFSQADDSDFLEEINGIKSECLFRFLDVVTEIKAQAQKASSARETDLRELLWVHWSHVAAGSVAAQNRGHFLV